MKKDSLFKTSQYYLDRIDPKRISFAREMRAFTKKELAEKIMKSPSAITQIEKGSFSPDLQTFTEIALALKVPPAFLSKSEFSSDELDLEKCHFRARRNVSQMLRRQSIRFGSLLVELIDIFEKIGIRIPNEDVTKNISFSESRKGIEDIALKLRDTWGLGMGPIEDLTFFLESKGIVIVCLLNCHKGVDAFSVWISNRPCIMIDFDGKPASRLNFDMAHELGHLILHEDSATGDVTTERQANNFASSFLAPAESFAEECPRKWNYKAFIDLKRRWKMSIQACLYRARELGIISEIGFRNGMIHISKKGQRLHEEAEFSKNAPVVLSQSLNVLLNELGSAFNISVLSEKLCIYTPELEDILQSQQVPKDIIERLKVQNQIDKSNLIEINKFNNNGS